MFTSTIRLTLIVITIGFGLYLLAQQKNTGLFFLLAGALLALGYFRYNNVWIAFQAYKKGNIEQARKLILKVKNPQFLDTQHRAYYDWIKGGIAASDGDLETAYKLLQSASKGSLRTQNDKSVIEYVLCEVALNMGNTILARQHIERSRSFPHRPQLDSLLADLERKLKEAQ